VGVGGELAIYARRHDAFAEVSVARWTDDPDTLADAGGQAVRLDMLGLRAGWNPARMPIRAWLGAELGTLTGRRVGLTASTRSGPWSAITSGFGVAWPMAEHVRLVGTFEVAAVLTRERVDDAQPGETYRPSGATARCALGLEIGWR
ncbi:MAG: hypothetical protein M3680_21125, partial [Myxococcota bacterium]|nr:hypothetical protein [Myxococcota bacterium]